MVDQLYTAGTPLALPEFLLRLQHGEGLSNRKTKKIEPKAKPKSQEQPPQQPQPQPAARAQPATPPRFGAQLYGPQEASSVGTIPSANTPHPTTSSAGRQGSNLDLQRFLLQAGISLMSPSWGGPLANIGQAVGQGAEAVGRAQEQQTAEQERKLNFSLKNRQVAASERRAGAAETRAQAVATSSRSKRLQKQKPEDRVVEGMSPEAQTFFRQRIKTMRDSLKPDPLNPDAAAPDATAIYNSILQETQLVDYRTRGAKGMLKADEIADVAIQSVVDDPSLENQLFAQVAADPIQTGLLRTRLEQARAHNATQ